MPTAPAKKTDLDRLAAAMPFLTAAAGLGLAASGYFFLLMPKIATLLPGGMYDVRVADARLREAVDHKSRLGALSAQYRAIDADKLRRLNSAVPELPDLPHFFGEFDKMAQASGFVLTNIDAIEDPRDVSLAGRRAIKLSIGIKGAGYADLKNFLASLESSERIYDVEQLAFTAGSVDYQIVLRTYYLDPAVIESLTNGTPPAPAAAP